MISLLQVFLILFLLLLSHTFLYFSFLTCQAALLEILGEFTQLSTKLSQLRKFVSSLLQGDYPLLVCSTYQAFCVACSQVLGEIDCCTTDLTKRIKAEGTLTLTLTLTKEV